jgi:hypothetical protein
MTFLSSRPTMHIGLRDHRQRINSEFCNYSPNLLLLFQGISFLEKYSRNWLDRCDSYGNRISCFCRVQSLSNHNCNCRLLYGYRHSPHDHHAEWKQDDYRGHVDEKCRLEHLLLYDYHDGEFYFMVSCFDNFDSLRRSVYHNRDCNDVCDEF